MPTGYAGEGKTYSKKLGRWLKKETTQAFDYQNVNTDSVALLINFFRWYPDYFCDLFRAPDAKYQLELPQRIMLRIMARYRKVYITAVRGATKTFTVVLSAMIEGVLFPGQKIRYCAPNQKQAASLATKAFHQIEQCYPIIANMWSVRNDRDDMFRIEISSTGSEFTMYTTRGDTTGAVIGEECGQEGKYPFDIEDFLENISPTVRDNRMVNQKIDKIHINKKFQYIGNATSKSHKAYTNLRSGCLKNMLFSSNRYEGFILDFSWITALMGNIRDIQYINDQKEELLPLQWLREMCARYTGSGENPLISDEDLARSRKLMSMENRHCGDKNCIYIVSHDVASEDSSKNAKCADVVIKLTKYGTVERRDKYEKQVIYADSYAPPKSGFLQAKRVKELYLKFCLPEGNTTYLVIDTRSYGKDIIEELMKPTIDGTKPLCCYNHMKYVENEQAGALAVMYPMMAGTLGTLDPDADMVEYAQKEFDQGNVKLLTSAIMDGVEQYKRRHNIKDNSADAIIIKPYRATDELVKQIQNLVTKTSGLTNKEERRSKAVQRDIWSALKYGLRFAQKLEQKLKEETYKRKSSWTDIIAQYSNGNAPALPNARTGGVDVRTVAGDSRSRLLGLRRR